LAPSRDPNCDSLLIGLGIGVLIFIGGVTAFIETDPVVIFQSITLSIYNMHEAQFQFVQPFYDYFAELMIALIIVHFGEDFLSIFAVKNDSTRAVPKVSTASNNFQNSNGSFRPVKD
jgi:cytochrome b561